MGAMGMFFPPTLLIPIHAIVQLTSNLSRAALSLKELRRDIFGRYLLGAIIGGGAGLKLVVVLPENILWLGLAWGIPIGGDLAPNSQDITDSSTEVLFVATDGTIYALSFLSHSGHGERSEAMRSIKLGLEVASLSARY